MILCSHCGNALPLGEKPDSIIAVEHNLSRRKVAYYRKRLNILPFIGKIISQEGLGLRSVIEAKYDAYLHWKSIEHTHEIPIAGTKYTADFKIGERYIEIAGMTSYTRYREKYEVKRKIYNELGIDVVWLSSKDVNILFSDCQIRLKTRINCVCEDCGLNTYDLVKNVCRKCYIRRWHKSDKYSIICAQCTSQFYTGDKNRKFCSLGCYHKSLKLNDSLDMSWVHEQMKSKSIRSIAQQAGIKTPTLYMRLRRESEKVLSKTDPQIVSDFLRN